MKTIIERINHLSKDDAKTLKLVAEMSLNCVQQYWTNQEQVERVDEVIEAIIEATKARIYKLACEELENN